jgi:hypothetical protein
MRWTLGEEEEEQDVTAINEVDAGKGSRGFQRNLFNQQFLTCSLSLLIMTSREDTNNHDLKGGYYYYSLNHDLKGGYYYYLSTNKQHSLMTSRGCRSNTSCVAKKGRGPGEWKLRGAPLDDSSCVGER